MILKDLRERLQDTLGDVYRIERELGRGGMSRVFLATHTTLERRIVFKVLPPELAAEVSVERFNREIRLAAQLTHPHIVQLLDAGSGGGILYYTMPYVEGESLRSLLDREKRLPVDTAVRYAREAADALDYAHRHGIVHRDIKPDNILLAEDHAVIADFGIARAVSQATGATGLTSATITLGTPAYMSPEQASAEREIDGRSDIYSLACVLFEMLAGQPPFTGPSQQAVIARRFREAAPRIETSRPDVPSWLADAIARGLETAPDDRYGTAREFARALGLVLSGETATMTSSPLLPSRPRRISRTAGLGGTLLAVAAIATGVWYFVSGPSSHSSPGATRAAAGADVAPRPGEPVTISLTPFANLSTDPENEFFADGMTEEVIHALSGIEGLRVAARSSVFALKGRQLDARTIGDTLGVSSVLEGSVRRSGTRLRVNPSS